MVQGGRQQRALEKILKRSGPKLDVNTRGKWLGQQALQERAAENIPGRSAQQIGYISDDVRKELREAPAMFGQLKGHLQKKEYLPAMRKGKELLGGLGKSVRFLRKGN